MNEPMPWDVPTPSPPPSLRWISTTPINASVTNRWMTSSTVIMDGLSGMARRSRRFGAALEPLGAGVLV